MAADHIIRVGNKIRRFQDETRDTTNYIAENLNLIEKSNDLLGVLYPYTLEFKIYGGGSAYLTLTFYEKFRSLRAIHPAGVLWTK